MIKSGCDFILLMAPIAFFKVPAKSGFALGSLNPQWVSESWTNMKSSWPIFPSAAKAEPVGPNTSIAVPRPVNFRKSLLSIFMACSLQLNYDHNQYKYAVTRPYFIANNNRLRCQAGTAACLFNIRVDRKDRWRYFETQY